MTGRRLFIAQPDVAIDPALPVPRWTLSERSGRHLRALECGILAHGSEAALR